MPYMETLVMPPVSLYKFGITNETIHYQESSDTLVGHTLRRKEGSLSNTEALVVTTGIFTGRSPQDKYIVADAITKDTIDWNQFNIPIAEQYFLQLKEQMIAYLNKQPELWVREAQACTHPDYKLNVRVINEDPWSNLFVYNMFIRPDREALDGFEPHWHILHAPGFTAQPEVDGTRQANFAIISFTHKTILIGGTGYTGEIKKGIFTVLNFLLPQQYGVLPMHCSTTIGQAGDTAIFFGLSGTGKTTLSADPERQLVGDDEHGWCPEGIFNFEGGCYAKVIDLNPAKEPAIYGAIHSGALVENTRFFPGTDRIDFKNKEITENTRASYPLHFIPNAASSGTVAAPQYIFFLTADAYGILPPISQLTPEQALYYFVSGYTARVAGTEAGVSEPKATFSACFGAPFFPLHPGTYAKLLGQKLRKPDIRVWLINTGWTGGPYGIGSRIDLTYTRSMIAAVLAGQLDGVAYQKHPVFGLQMPEQCPGVPSALLNPVYTWQSESEYLNAARQLAKAFLQNFEKYKSYVTPAVLRAAPIV